MRMDQKAMKDTESDHDSSWTIKLGTQTKANRMLIKDIRDIHSPHQEVMNMAKEIGSSIRTPSNGGRSPRNHRPTPRSSDQPGKKPLIMSHY